MVLMKPYDVRLDDSNFDEFYSSLRRKVQRFIGKTFRFNEADAEDMAQSAFLRAYEKRDTFRGDSKADTWIHTIAANVARGYLRKASVRREIPGLPEDLEMRASSIDYNPEVLLTSVSNNNLFMLRDELDSELVRDAFHLRFIEGLSFREISDLCGISESAARVRILRAKRELIDKYNK